MLNVRPYTPALQKLAAKFDCGNSYLNQFLRSPDALDAGVGKTFVFLTENAESIVGYYNLSCGSLDEIEGDVRYKIGGTIHIGYFAIDEKFQHQLQATTPNGIHLYWGDVLLEECLSRIEAIRSQQPDAVLMNLLLPNVDGLTLIRDLRKTDARLVLVCMSEFFSPTSIELMRRYQVDYFLFKPFAPQTAEIVLLDCLTVSEELRTMAREGLSEESEEKLEARIRQALRELNFSSRYVGFEHLTRAVAMAYEAPDCLRNLTAGLYPEIARRAGTTSSSVERAIRTAIATANSDQSLTRRLQRAPTNKDCILYVLKQL